MIHVLLVDDSADVRARLRRLLCTQPDIAVVGEAASGREALRMIGVIKPDVVLMDADMPGMDGFETTIEVMVRSAMPIIIVSAHEVASEADKAFRAMEAGAVALVALPSGTGQSHGRREAEIVQTVRAMAEVRVVRRRRRAPPATAAHAAPRPAGWGVIDLIAIGASTGGPMALQHVLAGLAGDLSAAVLVVQHITPDFQASFVSWLGGATGLSVHLARNGQALQRGRVYVAPHPYQMGIDRERRVVLRDDPPESGLRPAVSYLFRSVATVAARRTAAILLTGMGQDGAAELLELRARGALTIAQDEATSVVHGMPGEAIRLGGAMFVLSPDEIAALLADVMGGANGGRRGSEPASGS